MNSVRTLPKPFKPKEFRYDKIIPFNDTNFTIAIRDGKAGIIDVYGNSLTDFIYDDLTEYYEINDEIPWFLYEENYCSMRLNGKWGLLNELGETIIDFKYDSEVQTNGLGDNIIVILEGKPVLIDKFGKVITDNYDSIIPQINGFATVTFNDKVGLINSNGEVVIDCMYKWIEVSSSKYFVVVTYDDRWGIVDINKNTILSCDYDYVSICEAKDSRDVVFLVELNHKAVLCNKKGEII